MISEEDFAAYQEATEELSSMSLNAIEAIQLLFLAGDGSMRWDVRDRLVRDRLVRMLLEGTGAEEDGYDRVNRWVTVLVGWVAAERVIRTATEV